MINGYVSDQEERGPGDTTGGGTTAGKAGLGKIVTLRLSANDWAELENGARDLGVGPTTLIRMWVLERLRRHSGPSQEVLGAIELFLARAFREGILIRAEAAGGEKRRTFDADVLLRTPRDEPIEATTRGAVFFGNQVLN